MTQIKRPPVYPGRFTLNIDLGGKALHELTAEQLLPAISQAVEIESPIHIAELTRRVAEGAGLKRAGSRIQVAVQTTVNYGVRMGRIVQRGEFVWQSDMVEPKIRNRSDMEASSKKFEYVAPEEIRLAIRREIENSFSLAKEEAISRAARLLGFQRVTAQAKELFDLQLDCLLDDNLVALRDGMLYLGK